MSKRLRVKPSKGQSVIGFIIGLIFCFIGVFIVIPIFGPFGILWTLFAVIITISNAFSAFSDKGMVSHEIIIDDDQSQSSTSRRKSPEERLNDIQNLYEKGIITNDEYELKRKQILDEL